VGGAPRPDLFTLVTLSSSLAGTAFEVQTIRADVEGSHVPRRSRVENVRNVDFQCEQHPIGTSW